MVVNAIFLDVITNHVFTNSVKTFFLLVALYMSRRNPPRLSPPQRETVVREQHANFFAPPRPSSPHTAAAATENCAHDDQQPNRPHGFVAGAFILVLCTSEHGGGDAS